MKFSKLAMESVKVGPWNTATSKLASAHSLQFGKLRVQPSEAPIASALGAISSETSSSSREVREGATPGVPVDGPPRCVSFGSRWLKCASFSCLRSKSVRVKAAPQEHTNGFSLVSTALSSQYVLEIIVVKLCVRVRQCRRRCSGRLKLRPQ